MEQLFGSYAPTAFIPSHLQRSTLTSTCLPSLLRPSTHLFLLFHCFSLSLLHSIRLSAVQNNQKENRHSSAFSIGSSEFLQNKRADSLCEVISPGTNQHHPPAWCPPSPHPCWPLTLHTLSLSSFLSCSSKVSHMTSTVYKIQEFSTFT